MVILQGKLKDKDTNGGRDLFIVKKGFGSLPLFDGRVDNVRRLALQSHYIPRDGRQLSRTVGVDREADHDARAERIGCLGVRGKEPERFLDERPTLQLSLSQFQRRGADDGEEHEDEDRS